MYYQHCISHKSEGLCQKCCYEEFNSIPSQADQYNIFSSEAYLDPWALNLGYCHLRDSITCPEQMIYLLGEAATT